MEKHQGPKLVRASQAVQGEPSLLLSTTGSYNWVTSDKGSGADADVTIFRPNPDDSSYFIIGDYAQGNYGNPTGSSVIVKAINDDPLSPLLKPAKSWSCVWTDKGSGGDYDWSIWAAVVPDGYTAIGMVATLGYSAPDIQNYRCLRKDLVQQTTATTQVWSDSGSGADSDVTIWAIGGMPNAFVAQGNYTPYSGTVYLIKGVS
jgi:hypothetical protein